MSADEDLIRRRFEESVEVKRALLVPDTLGLMVGIADRMCTALQGGGTVIFCGNGGSAADATHLAAELVGRFCMDRGPLSSLSLSDNGSSVTAIGNDFGYEHTFARQVHGLGRPGDVLVGLSTSGTSPNVVAALEAAGELGLVTVGLTGTPGGRLPELADLCLCVPSDQTARIQEGYMLAGHAICELVEQRLFG